MLAVALRAVFVASRVCGRAESLGRLEAKGPTPVSSTKRTERRVASRPGQTTACRPTVPGLARPTTGRRKTETSRGRG